MEVCENAVVEIEPQTRVETQSQKHEVSHGERCGDCSSDSSLFHKVVFALTFPVQDLNSKKKCEERH